MVPWEELSEAWELLCEAEPRLDALALMVEHYVEISQASQTRHCQIEFDQRWLLGQLQGLLGVNREYDPSVPAALSTSTAFDTARFYLQGLSGACRNCEHAGGPAESTK